MILVQSETLRRAAAPWRERLASLAVAPRLAARDASLWGPAAAAEAAIRLGWLASPVSAQAQLAAWHGLLAQAAGEGIDRALVLGMGGSALAAEMFGRMGASERLRVLDSTHPRAVDRSLGGLGAGRSLVFVASKSGSTVETRRLADLARTRLAEAGLAPTSRLVALSDDDTPLTRLARSEGWRAAITTPADVGGRFSVFTAFGLLPALVAGLDVSELLSGAAAAAADCAGPQQGPALDLAAVFALLAAERRPLRLVDDLAGARSAWIEQLLAESLGKDGHGVWPLPPNAAGAADAPVLGFGAPGDIHLPCTSLADLGYSLMCTMWATAAAGALLKLQPFDQPDVEAAKRFAAAAEHGTLADTLPTATAPGSPALAAWWQERRRTPPRVLVVAAFIDPDGPSAGELPTLCQALAEHLDCPVVPAIGPRYLHATGQLHKGGPADIAALVLIDDAARGPTAGLLGAQALGDVMALHAAGRPAIAVSLGASPADALRRLATIGR
jgi:hypothetical protein